MPLSSSIPVLRIVHGLLPIRSKQKVSFCSSNPVIISISLTTAGFRNLQSKCDRHASPETLKIPMQTKGSSEGDRHRDNIVAEEVHISSNLLLTQSSQKTIAVRCQRIKELERCTDRKNCSDEVDDTLIICEELRNVIA